jgi:uncharacterized protein with PhoU and TrkA domain
MKNLTNMTVALAYSDLFYEDTNLQKELEAVHEQIKELEKENLKHIFKIRESDELRIKIIELMEYIKDISNACKNMSVLNSEGRVLPFPDTSISGTEERAALITVRKNSLLIGKTISESKARTKTGVTIKAVKRNDKWNFSVNKKTVIKTGDLLFVTGDSEAKKLFVKVADGTLKNIY